VVGGVAGGGHPFQRLEHRTGGCRADRGGDLADLEHLVGMRGEVAGDLRVQVPGPAAAGRRGGGRGGCAAGGR
jgi:hypothetical protein